MVDALLELIQRLPDKFQRVIGLVIAGLLFMFLVFLAYLYATGNLW